MFKINFFIGALVSFTFLLSNQIFCQEYFEFKNPNFSFSIPDGWKEYKSNPSLLIYGKYVKVTDGLMGGSLRVGKDIYFGNLGTIWNLNQEEEKKQLEKEASLRNFVFSKETINGLKTVKINFETTIGENDRRREFKAVIYKFLVKQDRKEHVISFFLNTETKDFYKDNIDFLKIISTLNLTSQKTVFNSQKEVVFKNIKYIISKPVEYDYFSNSTFKGMKINEFTKTYCFSDDISINDLELLVPKNFDKHPTIHFYTINALKNKSVTADEFLESKLFWKEMYKKANYDNLLANVISDSLLFCNYGISDTKPTTFTHLKDETNFLSTLVFINAGSEDNLLKMMAIINYIYINETVIFIKLSQEYKTFSDIEKIQNMSKSIVSEFLENNKK